MEEGDDNLNQLLLVNGLHGNSNLHREQSLVVEFDDYFGGVESVLDRPRNLFAEIRYLRVKSCSSLTACTSALVGVSSWLL